MLLIVIMMVVTLVVAGVVLVYVAFPRHGESLPAPAKALGEMMSRATDAAPTINTEDDIGPRQRGASLFD